MVMQMQCAQGHSTVTMVGSGRTLRCPTCGRRVRQGLFGRMHEVSPSLLLEEQRRSRQEQTAIQRDQATAMRDMARAQDTLGASCKGNG